MASGVANETSTAHWPETTFSRGTLDLCDNAPSCMDGLDTLDTTHLLSPHRQERRIGAYTEAVSTASTVSGNRLGVSDRIS